MWLEQIHGISDLEKLSEAGLEEKLDFWHSLSPLDEDELLRRLELHIDDFPPQVREKSSLVLSLIERKKTDPPGQAFKRASQCPGASGTEAGDPGETAGKAESERTAEAPQTGKRLFFRKLKISREIQVYPGSSRDIFLIRSSLLFQGFSNPENRDQKEDQSSCRHPEEGNVHSVDQGSVSVGSCGAFTYYCHNAYEHRGAHRSGDGSEGSQHGRGVRHFFQFHIAGSPGKQRHHQTADGKVPDHVKDSRCPKRGVQSKEGHADVADDQSRGADHKKLLNSHLIVHLSCQRTDHRSGQGAGSVTRPETTAEYPITLCT